MTERYFYFQILNISFFLFCLLNLHGCTFPIREQERLESDREFLSLNNKILEETNQEALAAIKNSKIEEAESLFKKNAALDPSNSAFLNLLRFYYLLDGYEEAKAAFLELQSKGSWDRERIEQILELLKEKSRLEERAILLDATTRVPGMEIYSWLELGNFFLYKGNLSQAEIFFENILSVQPFHEQALVAMSEIRHDQGDYYSLYEHAKSLQKISGNRTTGAYYFLAKSCFELGRYQEALQWISKATEKEKRDPAFMMVWRDSLLSMDPYASLQPLRPYYLKAVEDGFATKEDVFLPTLSQEGKELYTNTLKGR